MPPFSSLVMSSLLEPAPGSPQLLYRPLLCGRSLRVMLGPAPTVGLLPFWRRKTPWLTAGDFTAGAVLAYHAVVNLSRRSRLVHDALSTPFRTTQIPRALSAAHGPAFAAHEDNLAAISRPSAARCPHRRGCRWQPADFSHYWPPPTFNPGGNRATSKALKTTKPLTPYFGEPVINRGPGTLPASGRIYTGRMAVFLGLILGSVECLFERLL